MSDPQTHATETWPERAAETIRSKQREIERLRDCLRHTEANYRAEQEYARRLYLETERLNAQITALLKRHEPHGTPGY